MPTITRLKDVTKRKPKRENQSAKYYNSKQWKSLRLNYYRLHPLCELCLEEGKTTPTEHIHHIIPFLTGITEEQRWSLLLSPDNLCALCLSHHKKIHSGNR